MCYFSSPRTKWTSNLHVYNAEFECQYIFTFASITSITVSLLQEMCQLQLLQLLLKLCAWVGVRRQDTCLLYKLLQVTLPQLLVQLLQLLLFGLRRKKEKTRISEENKRTIYSKDLSPLTHWTLTPHLSVNQSKQWDELNCSSEDTIIFCMITMTVAITHQEQDL